MDLFVMHGTVVLATDSGWEFVFRATDSAHALVALVPIQSKATSERVMCIMNIGRTAMEYGWYDPMYWAVCADQSLYRSLVLRRLMQKIAYWRV